MKKIVLTGGGTAGHVTPNIALLPKLKELNYEIYYIGSYTGMEKQLIEEQNIPYYGISSGKLRRYFDIKNFSDPFKVVKGFTQAVSLLRKLKPNVVFSKGGFVSVPVILAARFLHIPAVIHESDFTPGLATKLNSCGAKNIFISYSETEKYFSEKKKKLCAVTGNPVRPVFYENHKKEGLDFLNIPENHNKKILFVSGGSLGARQINELVMENLNWLKENFIVVHQTGKAFAEENPLVMSIGFGVGLSWGGCLINTKYCK